MGIYLDHAATTYTDKKVLEAMLPFFHETYGNASSLHSFGRDAGKAVSKARQQVADALGVSRDEVYFTSGGTESDNWAIKGVADVAKKGHIITSAIEHHAVLDTCKYLEKKGFDVTYLPVDETGMVSPQSVTDAIQEDTILISIMFANNEVGTIMPIGEIAKIANENGILMHTDAVQAVGHLDVNAYTLGVDMMSLSAHKFYGPKGVGALFIKKGTDIGRFMHGGAQEKGMRATTTNTPAIVGIGAAIEIAVREMSSQNEREAALASRLKEALLALPATHLNGHETQRLPGNVNISFEGIEAEALMTHLDIEGIAVSTGSACSSGSTSPSYVILAMDRSAEHARAAVRFTVGRANTAEQIDEVIEKTISIVTKLREISPLFAQYKGDKKYV